MKVIPQVATGLGVLLSMATLAVYAGEPVGKVDSLQGQAQVERPPSTPESLKVGSSIFPNDKVITAGGGKLRILFNDGSVVSQGERSEMVIDEYVYSAGKEKESSSSVNLLKGVFRVVTGKITQMNPDRFKVKTRMATIGIRGCELGFRVREKKDDVFVIEISDGRSILIQSHLLSDLNLPDLLSDPNVLTILQAGVYVTIASGEDFKTRPISLSELRQLILDSTPDALEQAETERGSDPLVLALDLTDTTPVESDDKNQDVVRQVTDAMRDAWMASFADKFAELAAETPPPSEDGPSDAPPSDEKPPAGDLGPPVVGGNPDMNDWEWGMYSDGSSFYQGNSYLGAEFLTQTDYDGIRTGTTLYDLFGFGDAYAVIDHMAAGTKKTVRDPGCYFEVQIGNSVTPTWGADFNFSNADGDSLVFSVDRGTGGGTIDANGILRLNTLQSYNLTVDLQNYTEAGISSRQWEGQLIKPGGGIGPVSGVAGSFQFIHGSSVKVDGVYGADLMQP